MKLSTRTRYGIRAILELALGYSSKEKLTLSEIAKRQNISKRYLEHIIATLVSSGLVKSLRGKNGGFVLSKSPSQIKLSEVFRVLEGEISFSPCLDEPKECERIKNCVVRDIWLKLRNTMFDFLDSITLQDMLDMYFHKIRKSHMIYYI